MKTTFDVREGKPILPRRFRDSQEACVARASLLQARDLQDSIQLRMQEVRSGTSTTERARCAMTLPAQTRLTLTIGDAATRAIRQPASRSIFTNGLILVKRPTS